jgi:hypothetical protein
MTKKWIIEASNWTLYWALGVYKLLLFRPMMITHAESD